MHAKAEDRRYTCSLYQYVSCNSTNHRVYDCPTFKVKSKGERYDRNV